MKRTPYQSGRISTKGLVITLLLIVLIVATFFLFQNREPRESQATVAATSFIDAATERDSTASYAFFSDSVKERISQGAWQAQLDQLFAGTDPVPEYVSTTALDGQPESQRVRYSITLTTSEQETPYTMDLTMVEDGSSWKVDNIDIQKQ